MFCAAKELPSRSTFSEGPRLVMPPCAHPLQCRNRETKAPGSSFNAVLVNHPLDVNPALLRTTKAAGSPARAASIGSGRDLALGLFVPPLLSSGGPYLLRTALNTSEALICVETW